MHYCGMPVSDSYKLECVRGIKYTLGACCYRKLINFFSSISLLFACRESELRVSIMQSKSVRHLTGLIYLDVVVQICHHQELFSCYFA